MATFNSGPHGPYDPPIPTYEEAVAALPHAGRADYEAQSLLNLSGATAGPSSRRHQGNSYRQPTVESDDEHSDSDDENETNLVRREMQEFEVDDGQEQRPRSLWAKSISFSLPSWTWARRLRLPRFQIRLPSRPPSAESEGGGDPATLPSTDWHTLVTPGTRLFMLVARILTLVLVLGFLYLVFSGALVSPINGHMVSPRLSPEAIRDYILHNVEPRRLRASVQHFTSYAHLAGTVGGYSVAKDIELMFYRAGLENVGIDEYFTYLNHPTEGGRGVQLLGRDGKPTWDAQMVEADPGQESAGRPTLAFHAHSKQGTVEGPLMYANYGSREDFAHLKSMGIRTEGAVALVRYGGSQEVLALKVRAAEHAGFVGCLVYSDPADDGFLKGAVAPDGPYLPADGVRRGSVSLTNFVVGDVLTPGWESKQGLPRVEVNQTRGLVGIPSLPLAWRDAQVLLGALKSHGTPVPAGWAGGVPDVAEWWTGDASGPVVRVRNEQDEAEQKTIWNVYGRILGREQADKTVMIGNAHDSLAFGATNPHSGTAVLIEMARLFGSLAAQGWRPLRTIEFMSWDGEAYNHIGSTEFVEHKIKELRADAVAYVNLAGAVAGTELHASGSPVFADVLARALEHVSDPSAGQTLRALWEKRGGAIETPSVWDGSHVPFLMLAGTSALDLRFEGGAYPRGSGYDGFDFVNRFGDPGWLYHTLMGQVVGLTIVELADRHVLPLDVGAYAGALEAWVSHLSGFVDTLLDRSAQGREIRGGGEGEGEDEGEDESSHEQTVRDGLRELATAVGAVKTGAVHMQDWAAAWQREMLSTGWYEDEAVHRKRLHFNQVLALFESGLLDTDMDGGYPNRTQFKHVVFGPRTWSAKGEQFPGIRDAVEDGNWPLAARLVNRTVATVQRATSLMEPFTATDLD